VNSGIFSTDYLVGFTLKNSQVNLVTPAIGFEINPSLCYSGDSSQIILFESNVFYGAHYNGYSPFFEIQYGGPISFISNTFNNGFDNQINSVDSIVRINIM
jgi:hypothetical protein